MNTQMQLEHEIASANGEPVNLGAIKAPPNYVIMKDDSFYFLCWDGERSDYTTSKWSELAWAWQNYNFKHGLPEQARMVVL